MCIHVDNSGSLADPANNQTLSRWSAGFRNLIGSHLGDKQLWAAFQKNLLISYRGALHGQPPTADPWDLLCVYMEATLSSGKLPLLVEYWPQYWGLTISAQWHCSPGHLCSGAPMGQQCNPWLFLPTPRPMPHPFTVSDDTVVRAKTSWWKVTAKVPPNVSNNPTRDSGAAPYSTETQWKRHKIVLFQNSILSWFSKSLFTWKVLRSYKVCLTCLSF